MLYFIHKDTHSLVYLQPGALLPVDKMVDVLCDVHKLQINL